MSKSISNAYDKMKKNANKHDIKMREKKPSEYFLQKRKNEPTQLKRENENQQEPQTQRQNSIITPIYDSTNNSNTTSTRTIDLRCRYWIDQRLAQLLQNDNFTTRGPLSIKIRNGEFIFEIENQVVARVNRNGEFHGSNAYISGINVLAAIRQLQQLTGISGDLPDGYVRHSDLKNGTYELNVKDIITKFLEVLIPTLTANQTMNGLLFGKDDTINGNNAHLCFTYAGDDDVNNSLSFGFKGYTDQYIFYRDRCKFLAPFVSDEKRTSPLVCINNANDGYTFNAEFLDPNLTSNNGVCVLIGKAITNGNSSYLRYQWAGNNNANNYLSIGHYGYDNLYIFYRDHVEFFKELQMKSNANAPIKIYSNDNTPTIILGHDGTANNSMIIRYKHNTTPHTLGIGFYNNDDILTIDTDKNVYVNDGVFDVLCSAAHKIYQKLEYNSTLDNSEYIRLQFNDNTRQAVIDFWKTANKYNLTLNIDGGFSAITIGESNITLLGEVDVSSDLYIDSRLYTDSIYSNNQLYIEVNNSFRLFSDFWLDNHSISQICTSTDYANNQKIGDNALITSQAVKNAIAAIPTPQNIFDKTDEGEWSHTLPDEGYYCWALYYPPRSAYIIFRKDSALMYESPDGEHNWMSVALPALVNNNNVACLCVEDTMYYYNGLQLYKYTDVNTGWVSASVTLTIDNPTMACLNDFLIIAGGDSNTTQSVARYNRNNSNWTNIAFERGARRFVASGSDRVVTIEMNTSSTQKTIRWSFNGYNWDSISISHVQHTSCFAYGPSYNGIGCWVAGTYSGGGKCTCIWWDSPLANTPSYAAFDKPANGEVESIVYNEGVWLMYISGDPAYYYNRSALPCYGTWENATADNSHVDTRVFWCKDKFILLEDSNYTDEYNITRIDPIYNVNTMATITAKNISADNEVRLSRLEAQMNNMMMATLQTIYPVGAIYISMNPRSPEFVLGFGTWTQIVDKFLYCSNSSGTTGGEATHKITINEMPDHQHYSSGGWAAGPPNNSRWRVDSNSPLNNWDYTGLVVGHASSQSAMSLMPPYMTVYAWQRTA